MLSKKQLCFLLRGGAMERSTSGEAAPPGTAQQQLPRERQKSPPYAFYLAGITVVSASSIFGLTLLTFADLFQSAAAVTSALGSLFTVTGTVSGAYFGIKAASDTAERSEAAIERAYERADQAYQRSLRASGELPAETSQQGLQGYRQEGGENQPELSK